MDKKTSPSETAYRRIAKNIYRPIADEPNPAEPDPANTESGDVAETTQQATQRCDSSGGEAKSVLTPEGEGHPVCEEEEIADPLHEAGSEVSELKSQLQEVISRVSGLESKVLELKSQSHEACQEVKQMRDQSIADRTDQQNEDAEVLETSDTIEESPLASTLLSDIQSLVAEAWCMEESGWKEDKKNFDKYMNEAQWWANQGATLLGSIEFAVQNCDHLLSECEKVKESLPSELQDKLQGRQEGLKLTGKMAARLRERTPGLVDDATIEASLPFIGQHEWGDLLANETNEKFARKTIEESLKKSGIKRYQLISQARELAEGRRKRLLSFVEKQVLPILDGLDNGEQHSQSLVEQAMAENEDLKETLKAWLGTYNSLREQFLNVLAQIEVHPMAVEIRAPIDYARHEPFDVESDPDLPNEYIKAVIRNGYEYAAEGGGNSFVLRAAQVIVVKN